MYVEKDKLIATFNEFEETFKEYSLPKWNELPDIDLYMDQVITIISKYLGIYYETIGEEKIITPSMINNYVKLGTVPAPVKKKYSKVHLAYLLIICTLKQTLDMATIQRLIPINIDEATVEKIYNYFVKNQHIAYSYVIESVRKVANPILEFESDNQERMNDLLMQVSSSANILKILTGKITSPTEENKKKKDK